MIMHIRELINERNMSVYELSKKSNNPYTTLNDVVKGKTQLKRCSAETVYKLSKALHISMEELMDNPSEKRISFELYKSNVCHELKRVGDMQFIFNVLQSNEIRALYEKRWYPESFYLLAMLDYISRLNNVPICNVYDDIRICKLQNIIFPSGIIAMASIYGDDKLKEQAFDESIPEFKRFNIVEREVRSVI